MEYRIRVIEIDHGSDPFKIITNIDESRNTWDEILDLYEQFIEEYTEVGKTEKRVYHIFILDGAERYKEKFIPEENSWMAMYYHT